LPLNDNSRLYESFFVEPVGDEVEDVELDVESDVDELAADFSEVDFPDVDSFFESFVSFEAFASFVSVVSLSAFVAAV
jgi:hypothetical protein